MYIKRVLQKKNVYQEGMKPITYKEYGQIMGGLRLGKIGSQFIRHMGQPIFFKGIFSMVFLFLIKNIYIYFLCALFRALCVNLFHTFTSSPFLCPLYFLNSLILTITHLLFIHKVKAWIFKFDEHWIM